MAAVYEIWNSQLEMFRAVKLINPGSSESVRQRFQTEIKITAKLSHPNIVEIHGVGEWNGLPYIEMEKLNGTGLEVLLAERGALPPVVCTAIGIMICRALNYAHNQDCSIYGKSYHGVVHRDLKPANIMICTNGIVKLMDFGIARPADVSFHTMDGLVAGTLQYLAPEQLEKGKLDVTTDIYALGVTMYEIVTGVPAFPQTSFPKLIADKAKNKFKALEDFHINLTPRLRRLIYKCMEHAPERRAPSASALLDELHKIHAILTNKSPEEIMAAFTVDKGSKHILKVRKRFPWKVCSAACGVAVLALGVHRFVMPVVQRSMPRTQEIAGSAGNSLSATTQAPLVSTAVRATPESNASSAVVRERPSTVAAAVVTRHKGAAPAKPLSRNAATPTMSLMATLQEKYGTSDGLVLMEKELGARNFQNVLSLYDLLPNDQARQPEALILKMRVLALSGNFGRLSQFLESNNLNDGEFVLEKAKFAFHNKNYAECRKLLERSLNLPHAFVDYDVLKREVFYYTAQSLTAQFDATPTQKTYKDALDAWWQLRNALRNNPEDEYNRTAELELQRMAKKMQKG